VNEHKNRGGRQWGVKRVFGGFVVATGKFTTVMQSNSPSAFISCHFTIVENGKVTADQNRTEQTSAFVLEQPWRFGDVNIIKFCFHLFIYLFID
jgi:hypothetical protein